MTSVIIQKISKYYENANNLVAGKMKDETSGVPIKGPVRLKFKLYTFRIEDNNQCKKALIKELISK